MRDSDAVTLIRSSNLTLVRLLESVRYWVPMSNRTKAGAVTSAPAPVLTYAPVELSVVKVKLELALLMALPALSKTNISTR